MAHCRASSEFVAVGARSKLFVFDASEKLDRVIDLDELSKSIVIPSAGSCPSNPDKQVLGCAFSPSGALFCVLTSAKLAFVFECRNDWTQLNSSPIRLPKAPTAIAFDKEEKHIIVSDRAGNVNRFELEKKEYAEETKWQDINGEEHIIPLEPLLGHVSMVLDMTLSTSGEHILTGDRDEKLRISRYPNAYIIDHFCLGHTSYVKSIQVYENLVFTSGGDSTIRVWDIGTGETIAQCERVSEPAVRYLRIFKDQDDAITIAAAFENSGTVKTLTYNLSTKVFENQSSQELTADPVFDLCYSPNGRLFIVTKSGFGSCVKGSELSGINGTEDLVESLKLAADPIDKLEKNVGFNNMEEYLTRKEERMRKRKHDKDENENVEVAAKIS